MKTYTFDKVLTLGLGILMISLKLAFSNNIHYNHQEPSVGSTNYFIENSLEFSSEGINSEFQGFSFSKNLKPLFTFELAQELHHPKKEVLSSNVLIQSWFKPIYFIVLFIHAP